MMMLFGLYARKTEINRYLTITGGSLYGAETLKPTPSIPIDLFAKALHSKHLCVLGLDH